MPHPAATSRRRCAASGEGEKVGSGEVTGCGKPLPNDRRSGRLAARAACSRHNQRRSPAMSVAPSVSTVLAKHVTLEVEGLDRMYLNAYVPGLQYEGGVVAFFRHHRGVAVASSVMMGRITTAFVGCIESFV